MGLNYIKELNRGRLNIRPINFWQALGLSVLFDIVLMFVNTPTDAFYLMLDNFGVSTYSDFWYSISTLLSCIYQYGTLLIITVFINKDINNKHKIEHSRYFKPTMLKFIMKFALILFDAFFIKVNISLFKEFIALLLYFFLCLNLYLLISFSI